ncbi:MAG: hypothetical protein F4057_06250, partial [Acidobacteria bacterium]|nr:hypothetical protein [Acidobacteriota bacterium]
MASNSRRHRAGLRNCVIAAAACAWLASGSYATAHPIPFSYLDLRIADDGIEASLVAHMIDLAHEL